MPERTVHRRAVLAGVGAGALGTLTANTAAARWDPSQESASQLTSRQSSSGSLRVTGSEDSYADAEDSPSLDIKAPAITIEAWVKHEGKQDSRGTILSKGVDGGYDLSLNDGDEFPRVRFGVEEPDRSSWRVASKRSIPPHRWTHIAGVYDGEKLAIYIDGELDATLGGWSDEEISGNGAPLRIGADNNLQKPFAGEIDDVRVWDVARAPSEIKGNWNGELSGDEEGLKAYYTFAEASDGTVPDQARSHDLTLSANASLSGPGAYPHPPDTYAVGGDGAATVKWGDRNPDGTDEYRIYRSSTRTGDDREQIGSVGGSAAGYKDTDVENDSTFFYQVTAVSGGDESGLPWPGVATPSSGGTGSSMSFDGKGAYVDVGEGRYPLERLTELSIEAWIKHDGESEDTAALVSKGVDGGYELSFVGTGDEVAVRFGVEEPDRSSWRMVSEGGVPRDTWTHVAAVYDGSKLALYINGELDSTNGGWSDELVSGNNQPFRIGADSGLQRHYSGVLDEVRFWSRALDPDEVKNNMNTQLFGDIDGLVGYWRDCDGDGVYSAGTWPMDGTLEGTASCSGSDLASASSFTAEEADNVATQAPDETAAPDDGTPAGDATPTPEGPPKRGFFVSEGGPLFGVINETMLTLVGIVFSILGIFYQMLGGE